jgi:RNA polymerase sigma-70 factor, ECF subfamily
LETDEKLVEKAKTAMQGDLRAFDTLVERHQGRVRTNCRYLSGSEDDALDLAQEVFVKAYFNLTGFQGSSTFGTWIGRIKVNHCLNHLRRQRGKTFVELEDPAIQGSENLRATDRTSAEVEARDTRERIAAILDRMNETLRIPLIMRDMDGLSYQEISDELGLGLSAVKMRIKRARLEFRAAYELENTGE